MRPLIIVGAVAILLGEGSGLHDAVDILLIEDEPNIAEALHFILSRQGWRVGLHADGAGAVDAVRAARPRLVILDLMLPGRSGAEILTDLRGHGDFAGLKVLMLTARGSAEQATPGADDWLAKPFANDAVCAAAARLLG